MTDETGASGPDAPEPMEVSEPAPAATAAPGREMFSSSEGLVAFGGGLVIASYVIFYLILADYSIGWTALLFAVFAVLLPRAGRGFTESIAPLPTLMKAVGYILGIIGVFAVVSDVRFASSALNSFGEVLGALVAYAGCAVAFLGANSIKAG